jgi:hypothetical protein
MSELSEISAAIRKLGSIDEARYPLTTLAAVIELRQVMRANGWSFDEFCSWVEGADSYQRKLAEEAEPPGNGIIGAAAGFRDLRAERD